MSLFFASILKFLKGVPWQVWLMVAAAFALGWHLYQDKQAVKRAHKEGDRAGYTRAMNEVEAKARAVAAKADAVAAKIRSKNDEQARAIAARADDLRLRGPGAARCTPTISSPTSNRPQPAGGRPATPAPGLPGEDRGAVPCGWFIGQAERCDLNRNEVLSWREWYLKNKAVSEQPR
jgi:hypothetical protein